ncbi:UDP-glucose 4-epimerase (Galactowaldenase) (UDP-galactose 4-epimerase) [Legionella wadsworthii]|uniref:UDP-glucose 4-epimerase (Galactowaldenase) (UDP-galactose 4-epimerase) n=1 Tax=Legionella wadsworthii TaxID=28088 RepID=A0A378LML5_9GAMM|nr:NAD-dependent epimerase/dehydratase family protein [Legionella wadsworthii]STY27994.1 UDP-glucose 4-epimerase (Galactowaldenase) (UDP-galactose 4-epimerase) [Legionella wadsworthii]
MKVLVTGADGFIGKNLVISLHEQKIAVLPITRQSTEADLAAAIQEASFIIHLAGANRPKHVDEFETINAEFTRSLCDLIISAGRKIPIIYTSSTQAELDNPYGASKRLGEEALLHYNKITGAAIYIYRLPNVFGKWCKPNYNSAVATFCYNIINDLPIHIHDATAAINLVYIDDVVKTFIKNISEPASDVFCKVNPVYSTTVGELTEILTSFKLSRTSGIIPNVGTGLTHALYSTYVSYLENKQFSYLVTKHEDPRGVFVEMLKTEQSGQFSYFTAYPGITRGGHYHHSKTEKFLVIEGEARFRFRHIITGEVYECFTSGNKPEIVQTIPGWSHDITNVGESKMMVLLWANEIFDRNHPDTIMHEV